MKRIISVVAAVVIMCSLFLGSVCAAPDSAAKFKDIRDTDWFAEAVGKLNRMKIIDGLPGGLFNPKSEVTRAQFIKMLVQAMGYQKIDSVSFDDIILPTTGKAHWASVYIETALRNGVISKDEPGKYFYPDVPIKHADMFMMMFRVLKLQPSTGENPFADLAEANGTFTKLYEEYLVRGTIEGGKRLFKPFGHTTRAEAAMVLARMLGYKDNPVGFVARMGMEERFADGTQTNEDIAMKRALEIEKAKADPDYIMEPIITIEYNGEYKDYRWFELYFENIPDYTDGAKWKIEVVNYKQLNNFEMPRPNGTFVKFDITNWKTFSDSFEEQSRACIYILGKDYYTTQALIKDFKLIKGMKIEFKITAKQGIKERVVYKTVKLQ